MLSFFNFFLILSALFVFLSENSVHSILFLVLSFLNASAICFIFGADFIGLILITVYVGAIAVLFLFVIMMLNVKVQHLGIIKFLPIVLVLSLLFFMQIYIAVDNCYSNFSFLQNSFFFFDALSSEFFLGQVLYNYFILCVLLAGLILLVGMIGAILLTLNFKSNTGELSYRQIARSDQFLSFFK